jgi:hypothetical protein
MNAVIAFCPESNDKYLKVSDTEAYIISYSTDEKREVVHAELVTDAEKFTDDAIHGDFFVDPYDYNQPEFKEIVFRYASEQEIEETRNEFKSFKF